MSTIVASNISDGTDTVGMEYVTGGVPKAWANYNQITPAINDSLNVTSVTDVTTGESTVNYTNNMAGADDGGAAGSSAQDETQVYDFFAGSHYVITRQSGSSVADAVSMTLRWGALA